MAHHIAGAGCAEHALFKIIVEFTYLLRVHVWGMSMHMWCGHRVWTCGSQRSTMDVLNCSAPALFFERRSLTKSGAHWLAARAGQ